MRGVQLYPSFLSPREISLYRLHCEEALDSVKSRVTSERSRIRRYGYSYGKLHREPSPLENWPGWLDDLRLEVDVLLRRNVSNAITLNEFEPGGRIEPHSDSHHFDDGVGVLSLGSCVYEVYDGDPRPAEHGYVKFREGAGKLVETIGLSTGTLLVMRQPVVHACTATGEEKRYSIVFRRRSV